LFLVAKLQAKHCTAAKTNCNLHSQNKQVQQLFNYDVISQITENTILRFLQNLSLVKHYHIWANDFLSISSLREVHWWQTVKRPWMNIKVKHQWQTVKWPWMNIKVKHQWQTAKRPWMNIKVKHWWQTANWPWMNIKVKHSHTQVKSLQWGRSKHHWLYSSIMFDAVWQPD